MSSRRTTSRHTRQRFSPFPTGRMALRSRPIPDESDSHAMIGIDASSANDAEYDAEYEVTINEQEEEEEDGNIVIDDEHEQPQDAIVEEDGVSLREIGSYVASQGFSSDLEIVNVTPQMTSGITSINVMEILTNEINGEDLNHTLAGCAMIINRLMFENRYLAKELQELKASGTGIGLTCLDGLVFKKSNINQEYIFNSSEDGIPSCRLNDLVEVFDQNCTRRNEPAANTLRRLMKFQVIPKSLHHKYTVRERGGYERLVELPLELSNLLRDICLESVNLLDARTPEDRERQCALNDKILSFMKFALQELRRTPRKSKIAVAR
ncbi:hypothetical protein M3Y98_00429000 [Aphelenchoides besseyi]|nr:hypothetical protein M3Y98_00429000 [Aphelenchoides besseyi]KAI6202282.1 hypothetical protein M3Y96_00931600 [Aphelenchoides besseyi]